MVMLHIFQELQLQHQGSVDGSVLDVLHGHHIALVVDCLDVHLSVQVISNTKTIQRHLTWLKTMLTSTKSKV